MVFSVLVFCNAVSAIEIQPPTGIQPNPNLDPNGGGIPNLVNNTKNNNYSSCNTNFGEHISVLLGTDATIINLAQLNFTEVTIAGNTTIEEINSGSVPETPSQFILTSSSAFYEIETTATYTGPIIISLNYTGMTFEDESSLRLLHYENDTGKWVDCTTSIDTVNKIIYGLVNSLSPFAILERTANSPTNQNDANQNNQNTVNAANTYNSKLTNTPESVNAVTSSTGMQKTGIPLQFMALAVLSILGGLAVARKK